MAPVPVTVQRALTLSARRRPDKVALRWQGGTMTYAALDDRSTRLARGFLSLGLARGARVAALMPNGPEYIVLALACAKASLCMVPVNYRFTGAEVQRQLTDCDAGALVYGAGLERQAREGAQGRALQHITSGLAAQPGATRLEDLVAQASGDGMSFDAQEDDLFYLGYTSGTTGKPKSAMVTQRNRALAYHYWALEFGIDGNDVALHCGPFHHTAPFTFTLTQLFMGGEVVILDSFDAEAALRAIDENGVTWSFMVPFMLDRVLEAAQGRTVRSAQLRMLISGASPLPTRTKMRVRERFPAVSLHEFYGATEAGVVTNLRGEDQDRKTRCVGQPVAEIEIEIRDAAGVRLPAGDIGDIWLRGPTVFSGYFNAPERTAEVTAGDWCTLGDVGRLDEEGFLYLVDRSKDVIKSGGVNIYPIEIEEVILRDDSIRECAVVGMADERWGEAVHAFVVFHAGREKSFDALQALCAASLAGYKRPRAFHALEALPRNANGKVLKRELRDQKEFSGVAA